MSGTIDFNSLTDLAEFLKEFHGATAVFRVYKVGTTIWRLEFTGGY